MGILCDSPLGGLIYRHALSRFSLCTAVVGCLSFMSSSEGKSAPQASTPNELHHSFSDADAIDPRASAAHDMTKPFVFAFEASSSKPIGGEPLTFVADIGTMFHVWLDKHVPPADDTPDARSLAIQISSEHDENVKDKIFFSPVHWHSARRIDIDSDQGHYFSFDYMLDPHYENPTFWAMHMQVIQCCAGNPPLTMSVTPNPDKAGPVEISYGARDDEAENQRGRPQKTIFKMQVQRGVWNHVVLFLLPTPDGSERQGRIVLWNNKDPARSYVGDWGYKPGGKVMGHTFTNALGIDIGVYRRRQATTQTIYFDNINYGVMKEPPPNPGPLRPGQISDDK